MHRFLQVVLVRCEEKLSIGIDPKEDVDVIMENTALTVVMPIRKSRQSYDNEVILNDGEPTNVINRFDVNCELNQDRIVVNIEFADRFYGVIYSKGFKDDPRCK